LTPIALDSQSVAAAMMKAIAALAIAALVPNVAATELTHKDWDEKTAGKSVFVKFLAPW